MLRTRPAQSPQSAMFKLMAHEHQHECAGPRRYVHTRRVDECRTMDELFLHCLPAFGGAYLRRIYQILDRAIGMGCPLTLADLRTGHRLRPAPDLADPAARNRLGGLPQHHRRRLLSRRPPQPGRLQVRPRSTKSRSTATTPRCATKAPSASPTWPSTKACCSIRTASSPPCWRAPNSSAR